MHVFDASYSQQIPPDRILQITSFTAARPALTVGEIGVVFREE